MKATFKITASEFDISLLKKFKEWAKSNGQ